MTFKEAMERYRAGTASAEEKQLVEAELEKHSLIAEYLDEQWDETAALAPPPAEEMRRVRKSLRRRNGLIVITSIVLAAALLLTVVLVGIPAAERLYWDPTQPSGVQPDSTDLELMLAAYAELFCPAVNVAGVSANRTGFARYDVSLRYWDANRGGDVRFVEGSIEKGQLHLPQGTLQNATVNLFERATYPFYPEKEWAVNVCGQLEQLPEYITVTAAVSFPKDLSMEELLVLRSTLQNGEIGWVGIRTSAENEQLLPLCGMQPFAGGTVWMEANWAYPDFELSPVKMTAENLEAHFRALLQLSADQVGNDTGIDLRSADGQSFYEKVLDYTAENGVYSYGCFVSCSPGALLALVESGAVSQVRIEELRLGF